MRKPTWGPVVKERVRHFLEALLSHANELYDVDDFQFRWENSVRPKLVVETKRRCLERLTNLKRDQIYEVIESLKTLEILEDNRTQTQGKEDWHFTLRLWGKDTAKNLSQFDREWENKRPEKSKSYGAALEVVQPQDPISYSSEPKVEEMTSSKPDFVGCFEVATDKRGVRKEAQSIRVFVSYCNQAPDISLAQQLCADLSTAGKEVFIVGESVRLGENWSQRLNKELERCDCFVLLFSSEALEREMVTESVRRVKDLRDSRQDSVPKILAIHIGCPTISPLNYNLRGYLQGIHLCEWRSPGDTPSVVQTVLNLLAKGRTPVPDETGSVLPNTSPVVTDINGRPLLVAKLELPEGQVPLNSGFYIERSPIEKRCYEEILQPGALIRIKAPRLMGKTSLMARILYKAREHGYETVPLSFQLADRAVFTNLDTFLRWFCESIGRRLHQLNQLDDYWTTYGSKDKTTAYFEECLLEEITSPLVVSLDGVDRLFPYRDIADDFFSLLRAWYEYAKYGDSSSELWKKLRVVLVHSKEVYLPLDINQSPFNVGLSVELQEFSLQQVQDLVGRHSGLNWTNAQTDKLMDMVGGHPYLVRLALYHIQHHDITLQQLLQTGFTEAGIYSDHLRRHLWNLKQHPALVAAFSHVVTTPAPVELDSESAFKLHSMGLVVHRHENKVAPRCNLYRQYFHHHLGQC